MKVLKKINNNVVLALDEDDNELFIVGKGLGFAAIPYYLTAADSRIEKVFVLKNSKENMIELFEEIPTEIILLADKIVKAGSKILNCEFQTNILLTLADHINFAFERIEKKFQIDNPLHWEVLDIYPQEVEAAKKGIEIIESETQIKFPEAEITFIAMHFVTAQLGEQTIAKTHELTKVVKEIIEIVEESCEIPLDKNSIAYKRFLTHVRYFAMRQMNDVVLDGDNQKLLSIVSETMKAAMKIVKAIDKQILLRYNWSCSDGERAYLAIHIHKLINYRTVTE